MIEAKFAVLHSVNNILEIVTHCRIPTAPARADDIPNIEGETVQRIRVLQDLEMLAPSFPQYFFPTLMSPLFYFVLRYV